MEDPANEPKKDMYVLTVDPEDAPDTPEYVEIAFESGTPVSVNGEKLSPAQLLTKLNDLGGKHGVGRCDMVENRCAAAGHLVFFLVGVACEQARRSDSIVVSCHPCLELSGQVSLVLRAFAAQPLASGYKIEPWKG